MRENSAAAGGGIYNDAGLVSLSETALTENVATESGGGLSNDTGTVQMTDSMLRWNSAQEGGGIHTASDFFVPVSSTGSTHHQAASSTRQLRGELLLTRSTLSENTATNGGGLYNSGAILIQITQSTLRGNTATANGGGMVNTDVGTLQ